MSIKNPFKKETKEAYIKYDSTKTYFLRKDKTATVVKDEDPAHNIVAKPASDGYMGVYTGNKKEII